MKKYLYYTAIFITAFIVIYFLYLWIFGVNTSFRVENRIPNVYQSSIMENEPIDVIVKINGDLVYRDSVYAGPMRFHDFQTNLHFGYNLIEVYSNKMSLYHRTGQNIYFNVFYDIIFQTETNYFENGKYIVLDDLEKKINDKKIEDSNLEEHNIVRYNGIELYREFGLYRVTVIE